MASACHDLAEGAVMITSAKVVNIRPAQDHEAMSRDTTHARHWTRLIKVTGHASCMHWTRLTRGTGRAYAWHWTGLPHGTGHDSHMTLDKALRLPHAWHWMSRPWAEPTTRTGHDPGCD